jgi:hypothetical protein
MSDRIFPLTDCSFFPSLHLSPSLEHKVLQIWYSCKPYINLLRVSCQIYAESAMLPYTLSTFSFLHMNHIPRWIVSMPPR